MKKMTSKTIIIILSVVLVAAAGALWYCYDKENSQPYNGPLQINQPAATPR